MKSPVWLEQPHFKVVETCAYAHCPILATRVSRCSPWCFHPPPRGGTGPSGAQQGQPHVALDLLVAYMSRVEHWYGCLITNCYICK